MNKKLLLSLFMTLMSLVAFASSEIDNDILQREAGRIYCSKSLYLITDTFRVEFATPTLYLKTGGYRTKEDKVEEATASYQLTLVYNNQSVVLSELGNLKLKTGSDVNVEAITGSYRPNRSLVSLFPNLNELTGKAELKLVLKYDIFCVYHEGHDRRASFTTEKVFNVYVCHPGSIGVDESVLPRISSESAAPVYGLYNADRKQIFTITSEEDPQIYHLGEEEYVTCAIQTSNQATYRKEVKRCSDNNSSYDFQFVYSDMFASKDRLLNGVKRFFTRTYSNSGFSCRSNTIEVESIDTLSIDGFANDENTYYVCTKEYDEDDELDISSDNVLTIHGNSVNWDQTRYPKELYDVEYGWEYHTSANSTWLRVNNNINDDLTSNPNLYLPRSFFKENLTYSFRQVVFVRRFNWKVYANGSVNKVTVVPYKAIERSDFVVEPIPQHCAGEILADTMMISFKPRKGTYCSYTASSDGGFDLKYDIQSSLPSLTGEILDKRVKLPFVVVGGENITNRITVEDGCHNKVQFATEVTVNQQPQLRKEYVDVEGGSSDVLQSDVNILRVQAPQGKNVRLRMNGADPEQSTCHYYISFKTKQKDENGDYIWGNRSSINVVSGYTIPSLITGEPWYSDLCDYIKIEKENIVTGCLSKPLYVCVQYLGEVLNNRIESSNKKSVHLCMGDANPQVEGTQVSGGYGDNTYSYVWQYSNDSQTWMNMLDAQGKFITTQSLPQASWSKRIDKTYYVRRMATSLRQESSEGSAIKSYSDTLTFHIYTKPILSLYVNDKKEDQLVCYNNEVRFSSKFENEDLLALEGYAFHPFYAHEDYKGIKHFTNSRTGVVTKDSLFYAAVEFCRDTIFSANAVRISVGPNLRTESAEVSHSNCLVRGDSITLSVSPQAGCSYSFVTNGDTTVGTHAKVLLPQQGALYYSVTKQKDGCHQSSLLSIQGDVMQEPLESVDFSVVSAGMSLKDGIPYVCANNVLSVVANNEKVNSDIRYRWRVNDMDLDPTLFSSNSLTTNELEYMGSSYDIIRISSLMSNDKVCQTHYDTLSLRTYPMVTGGSLFVEKDKLCYRESATLQMNTTDIRGGSGDYRFTWKQTDADTTVELSTSESPYFETAPLSHSAYFNAVVSDKKCTVGYQRSTSSVKVDVEKDLSFTLKATPTTINSQTLSEGTSVSVNIISEDIQPAEKINCWCNGKKIKGNESYVSGISYSLRREDFTDNMAIFVVERLGGNGASCSHTESIEVLLNEGFDGVPVILSTESLGSSTMLCGEDRATLSVDVDQLPKYDNKLIMPENFDYQWYKKSGERWSTCGSSVSLEVKTVAGAKDEYRCKLSYTPKGGARQSIYSDIHTVEGIDVIHVGSVSFFDNNSKIFYVCKGAVGTVSMTTDSLSSASQYQWYEKRGEADWSPVPHERGTVGADSRFCTIDLENYNENTSFKLVATNECGVLSESINQIQVVFNAGTSLSESDIIVSSNTIYEGLNLSSISLCVPKDYKNRYFWTADPSFAPTSWHTGNPITMDNDGKGFEQGKDSVFVYMVSNGYGDCPSDTIVYHFDVFEKLKAAGITFGSTPDTLCLGHSDFDANLNNIVGGDGEYKVDWFYKTPRMTDFLPVEEHSHMPFAYVEDYVFKTNKNRSHALLTIGDLEETCEFYAVVSCLGAYPGRSYWTNSYVKYVYDRLSSGDIDNRTVLLCYGDALASIKGEDARGGDGTYSYQWLKSTDRVHWEKIAEQTEASYQGQSSQEAYRLYQTTYFCRVVTDGCGHSDTSSVKSVQVKSEVVIQKDDVMATTLVPRGDKASLWGVVNGYSYVWFDKNRMIVDTTDVRGVYATSNIDESVRTYYVKVLYDGCLSGNYDTIQIHTYDIDGGHLSFDDFDKNPDTDKYWICSGADAGRISADGGGNLEYRWFYTINDTGNARSYTLYSSQNTANPVTTSSVLLDTCNLKSVFTHASGTQLEKKISFYRVSYFSINGEEQTVNSDTVSLYVVPSLNLATALLLDGSESMAGVIKAEKELYCPNESGALIDGTVAYQSALYTLWSNGQFGPYLYDKEAPEFTTWYEVGKDGVWEKEPQHVGVADYAQYYNLPVVDTLYSVRRGFSDGCSSTYSNMVRQSLSNKAPNPGKLSIKGITPEGKTITSGMEFGDALLINYTELGYDCYWFADERCMDTLVSNNQLLVIDTLSANTPSVIYLKRKDNTDAECFSEPLAIPLTVFTKSDGGMIYKDQYVCRGDAFESIVSGRLASGYSHSPASGVTQKFTYQWQISNNGNSWMNIEGATAPDSLSADRIRVLTQDGDVYYIRRMAIAATQRVCYSDTVKLQFYDELLPGEISVDGERDKFCAEESLPMITSTQPTGGYYGYLGVDGYAYGWDISLNDGAYVSVSKPSPHTGKSLDLEYILRYSGLVALEKDKDNRVNIRASYKDDCKSVYSQPISLMLWAKNDQPSIYQDKESCDADAVTIKTYGADRYTFTWVVLDDDGQVTWSYTQDSLRLQRVSEMKVTDYAVVGVHKTSGCQTSYTYFNIDSLPSLHQEDLLPLDRAVCYGDSIRIVGGVVAGGNGSKEFLWQYSYDQEEYRDISREEDLLLADLKHSLYIRRIITDKCSRDTSNVLFVPVKKKIEVDSSDLLFHDRGCPGQIIDVTVNKERDEALRQQHQDLGISAHYWRVDDVDLLDIYAIDGFEAESKEVRIQLVYVDTLSGMCASEEIPYLLHNASVLDSTGNVVSCDNPRPCNNTLVRLTGGEYLAEKVTYGWYQSENQKDWVRIGGEVSMDVLARGTTYYKRVVGNGCSSVGSNVIVVDCQENSDMDYPTALSLTVASRLDAESDYVQLMIREHVDEGLYEMRGDGDVPSFAYGVTQLPYAPEVYQDSSLVITYVGGCYNSYRVSPLWGGRIYSNEETLVCSEKEIPSLIATEVGGGTGQYTYQWMYRNEHVKQYVAIPNAQEASYTPDAVTSRTWFQRVTTSGNYLLYSNEIMIDVVPKPKVSSIYSSLDSLESSASAVEGTDIALYCRTQYGSDYLWQQRKENGTWGRFAGSGESEGVVQCTVTAEDSVTYYRLIVTNGCSSDTSDIFKLLLLDVLPITDDDVILTGGVCPGDDVNVGIYYSKEYEYKYEGYTGKCVTLRDNDLSEDRMYAGEWTNQWVSFLNVQHSFDLKITRRSVKSGAITSYVKRIVMNKLEPAFSFVVGNTEYPVTAQSVAIEQGELVRFKNQTQGDNIESYYWELIRPMNTPSYITPYGLYSYQENPECYFYNASNYVVSLSVTDANGCVATVENSALYIPQSSVRSGRMEKDAEFVEVAKPSVLTESQIEVFPTLVTDYLHIVYEGHSFVYRIYDISGQMILQGEGENRVTLNTENLSSGSYLLQVENYRNRICKR